MKLRVNANIVWFPWFWADFGPFKTKYGQILRHNLKKTLDSFFFYKCLACWKSKILKIGPQKSWRKGSNFDLDPLFQGIPVLNLRHKGSVARI